VLIYTDCVPLIGVREHRLGGPNLSEFEYMSCDESILQSLFNGALWLNEISRRTNKNKRSTRAQLAYLERMELVKRLKKKNRKLYELTSKGKDACAYYRIRQEAGYSGIEWARNLFSKGYKVRFLQDLTGLPNHKRWLFAWNPETGDSDLAMVFGTRSVKTKDGSPAYVAQYVDRNQNPDLPIRQNELFTYIKQNVSDFNDENQMSEVLKNYWNPKTHNSFFCVLVPYEDIAFGFPVEIGHFSMVGLIGFGYQEFFPFIPRMNFVGGFLNLSENFRVKIDYWINLIAQHTLVWMELKKKYDPPTDPQKMDVLEKMRMEADKAVKSELFQINVSCRHIEGLRCRKMGIDCVAVQNGKLEINRCPILIDELRKM